MLNKLCTRTATTRAIPSLHRDNFLAEVSGPARCLRRVPQPPFIAGPLGVMHPTIESIFISQILKFATHDLQTNTRNLESIA
jgi:hypothetical protein